MRVLISIAFLIASILIIIDIVNMKNPDKPVNKVMKIDTIVPEYWDTLNKGEKLQVYMIIPSQYIQGKDGKCYLTAPKDTMIKYIKMIKDLR